MVQIKGFIERAVGRGKGTRGWWQWELLLWEDKAVVLERLQKQRKVMKKYPRISQPLISCWKFSQASPTGSQRTRECS